MKGKFILVFGILLISSLISFGCSGTSISPLVGKWAEENDPKDVVLEFFKDGSGIVDGSKVTWTASENGQLTFKDTDGRTESYVYEISGSILTLIFDGGWGPSEDKFIKIK